MRPNLDWAPAAGLRSIASAVVIIAHQGILRIIYAYLMGISVDKATTISIPLHTVIKLNIGAYTCHEERVQLVDTEGMKEPPSH